MQLPDNLLRRHGDAPLAFGLLDLRNPPDFFDQSCKHDCSFSPKILRHGPCRQAVPRGALYWHKIRGGPKQALFVLLESRIAADAALKDVRQREKITT